MNTPNQNRPVKPFWPPFVAGIVLGLVLLLTFVLSGHGLGASGAANDLVAGVGLQLVPEATKANGYLGPQVADGSPLGSWMTWEIVGVAIGALFGAFMAGRFRVQLDGERSVGAKSRLVKTLVGGILAGFGARIAGGCTSGLAISGGMLLVPGAFVFIAGMFVSGIVTALLIYGRRY